MLCVHLLVTHRHWAHSCVVVVCRVADFAWAWINAVSRGTMSLYVQRILEIPQLTNQGSLQLAADIRTATTTHPPYLCFRTALPRVTDAPFGWQATFAPS